MDRKQWKHQRDQWKSRLEEWQSPQDFHDALDRLVASYGRQLLSKSESTSLFRDAHTASAFAFHRDAEKVRLIKADQPDFEIEVFGRKQMYEVVEADTPGRRRSDEIKHQPKLATGASLPNDFVLTAELAPQILEAAANRKDKDIYLPDCGLVIVLNPAQPGGREQQNIEEGMIQATAIVKNRFEEVWVLWEATAYNLWLRGAPGKSVLRPLSTCEDAPKFTPTPLSALFSCADDKD